MRKALCTVQCLCWETRLSHAGGAENPEPTACAAPLQRDPSLRPAPPDWAESSAVQRPPGDVRVLNGAENARLKGENKITTVYFPK